MGERLYVYTSTESVASDAAERIPDEAEPTADAADVLPSWDVDGASSDPFPAVAAGVEARARGDEEAIRQLIDRDVHLALLARHVPAHLDRVLETVAEPQHAFAWTAGHLHGERVRIRGDRRAGQAHLRDARDPRLDADLHR